MPDELLHRLPVFVLVFFRLAGMMIYAPLFGSARIPRRVRVLLVLVLTMGVCGSVRIPDRLPESIWQLAVGIGGEMAFGIAMGMVMSFVFIAAQWAGEMIGQQMGLNLSEVFDPQFSGGVSLIGDLYFMFTLIVFMSAKGDHAMLVGVRESFDKLPLLSLSVDQSLFDLLVGLFEAATTVALRLAAPMLMTMLVVDLALGLIGRTMPQMNVMQAGMSVRSVLGLGVVWGGMGLTAIVIEKNLASSIGTVLKAWAGAK